MAQQVRNKVSWQTTNKTSNLTNISKYSFTFFMPNLFCNSLSEIKVYFSTQTGESWYFEN